MLKDMREPTRGLPCLCPNAYCSDCLSCAILRSLCMSSSSIYACQIQRFVLTTLLLDKWLATLNALRESHVSAEVDFLSCVISRALSLISRPAAWSRTFKLGLYFFPHFCFCPPARLQPSGVAITCTATILHSSIQCISPRGPAANMLSRFLTRLSIE